MKLSGKTEAVKREGMKFIMNAPPGARLMAFNRRGKVMIIEKNFPPILVSDSGSTSIVRS